MKHKSGYASAKVVKRMINEEGKREKVMEQCTFFFLGGRFKSTDCERGIKKKKKTEKLERNENNAEQSKRKRQDTFFKK